VVFGGFLFGLRRHRLEVERLARGGFHLGRVDQGVDAQPPAVIRLWRLGGARASGRTPPRRVHAPSGRSPPRRCRTCRPFGQERYLEKEKLLGQRRMPCARLGPPPRRPAESTPVARRSPEPAFVKGRI